MLKFQRIDFGMLEMAVLAVLAKEFEESDNEYSSLSEIKSRLPQYSANAIRHTLIQLTEQRGVRRAFETRERMSLTGSTGQTYDVPINSWKITQAGIETVYSWDQKIIESVAAHTQFGSSANSDRLEPIESTQGWEPLRIDRQSDEYKSMLEATEMTIEAIEANNDYRAHEREESEGNIRILRGALDVIKNGTARLFQIRSWFLSTLGQLAKKFEGHAIGALAKNAYELAETWIKSLSP